MHKLSLFYRRILTSKNEILHSKFYINVKTLFNEVISELGIQEIKNIICFGLGHIGDCLSSQYQLAFLLNICDEFNITNTLVYDPIFSEIECQILQHFGLQVEATNKEGKYKICPNEATLLYAPHCPKQLMNNFLWKNWEESLSNCIIIGNSFSQIVETNSKRILEEQAAYLLKICPYTKEFDIENNFKFTDIFNDTSIHSFPKENIKDLLSKFWLDKIEPAYISDDIEFITNAVCSELQIT